jgi:hypothetical protein
VQTIAYQSAYGKFLENYFSATSPLPKIAIAFSVLTCVFGIVAALLSDREQISEQTFKGGLSSLPAAVGFLAGAVFLLFFGNTSLIYAIAGCFLLAALYNVLLAFQLIESPTVIALIGFSNIIGCILLIGHFYFDTSMEMNAPVKISALIALLFTALFYTYEVKALLGTPHPRFISILTVCTAGIGALASIPLAFAYIFFHCFDYTMLNPASGLPFRHPEYLACSLVLIGVCITAAWRICRLICPKESQ